MIGTGSIEFNVIFNYCGLVFIQHNLNSETSIAFGGAYFEEDVESLPINSMLFSSNPSANLMMKKSSKSNTEDYKATIEDVEGNPLEEEKQKYYTPTEIFTLRLP